MLLSDHHRLRVAKCCTLRTQVDHCLIYNLHTDELHVVPLPAAGVLKLCDGTRTVRSLSEAIASASGASREEARSRFDEFAYELVKRGILTIGTDDAAPL